MYENIGMMRNMHNTVFGIPQSILFQIIILASFFLIIYWIFKNNKTESAIDILNKRYVRNEISKTEFLKIKKDIE